MKRIDKPRKCCTCKKDYVYGDSITGHSKRLAVDSRKRMKQILTVIYRYGAAACRKDKREGKLAITISNSIRNLV